LYKSETHARLAARARGFAKAAFALTGRGAQGDLKGKFLAVPQSPSQQQVYANSIVVLKHHVSVEEESLGRASSHALTNSAPPVRRL
jgi:hypothetical protein